MISVNGFDRRLARHGERQERREGGRTPSAGANFIHSLPTRKWCVCIVWVALKPGGSGRTKTASAMKFAVHILSLPAIYNRQGKMSGLVSFGQQLQGWVGEV